MAQPPFIKEYLMTAGPTPLPPRVSQIMAEPILYHRAPAFIEVYARVLERLPAIFGTTSDVLTFASSGSGAMESAVANLVRPGEPALVVSCGKFGERWKDLCDAYGADTRHFDAGWGNRVEAADLDRELEQSGAKVAFTTLSETSTGVVSDLHALGEVAKARGAILAVDAVSALGAIPVAQDAAGVDVVVAGSQKALMCPPGLAFASVSERALEHAAASPGRRFYFDWQRTAKGQRKDPPDSPFTPAVSLFMALDVALDLIYEEGLDAVYARHALLGRAARAAAKALDLELFGAGEDESANVVTAIKLPDSIDGGKVPKVMRDKYGFTIAGGQNQLKGKIARIAHCGYYGPFDVLSTFSAFEMTLRDLGAEVELGAGVAAAQRVFLDAGVTAGVSA
jgi:aspartate aminotransferase-like enzyme